MIGQQELDERIASRPDQFGGEPFVVTAQVPVADVLQLLTRRLEPTEIFSRYPGISGLDLLACLQFFKHKVEAAIEGLPSHDSSGGPNVNWQELQSRHGVSDEFLDAARQVFEQHDELLRRLA